MTGRKRHVSKNTMTIHAPGGYVISEEAETFGVTRVLSGCCPHSRSDHCPPSLNKIRNTPPPRPLSCLFCFFVDLKSHILFLLIVLILHRDESRCVILESYSAFTEQPKSTRTLRCPFTPHEQRTDLPVVPKHSPLLPPPSPLSLDLESLIIPLSPFLFECLRFPFLPLDHRTSVVPSCFLVGV